MRRFPSSASGSWGASTTLRGGAGDLPQGSPTGGLRLRRARRARPRRGRRGRGGGSRPRARGMALDTATSRVRSGAAPTSRTAAGSRGRSRREPTSTGSARASSRSRATSSAISGIAFGVALLGIYGILIYQTGSVRHAPHPHDLDPAHADRDHAGLLVALGVVRPANVGGFANPTFFTATAMIGMIALAGIAVRNAILLIEFLHVALRRGQRPARGNPRRRARCAPGRSSSPPGPRCSPRCPITLDPIFSGLAWALIFGLLVSTAFTLLVVPVAYYRVYLRSAGARSCAVGRARRTGR